MNVIFEGFLQNETEVAGFSAIAIGVSTLVLMLLDAVSENPFRILDILTDFRQIGEFKRGTELLDYIGEGYFIEEELIIFHPEFWSGEIKGLLYEVDVTFHISLYAIHCKRPQYWAFFGIFATICAV